MRDKLKQLPASAAEFWNKYTSKQKTIMIAVLCAVLIAVALLAYFISRPTWTKFQQFSTLQDASTMKNALDDKSIDYKVSNDGLTLYVKQGDMTDALYTMSDKNLTDTGYTWDEAFDNSMSTTENEKSQKRVLALQSEIQKSLKQYSFVSDADVFINTPTSSYNVLDDTKSTSITARIKVSKTNKDQLTSDTAEALAYWLANAVGTDVKNVIINDSDGNPIYNGVSTDALGGSLTGGTSEYCEKLRNTIANNVTNLLLKSNYDDVQVGTQGIIFDMNKAETLSKTYKVPAGRDYGYPTDLYTDKKNNAGSNSGGSPGTTTNSDTTDYQSQDNTSSTSTEDIQKLTGLLTDETIKNIKKETPAIEYANSSLGIVVSKYVVYNEDQLTADGKLKNMTFDQFIAKNSATKQITVSQNEVNLIAAATGVSANKISVIGYEVPKFEASTSSSNGISDYLMIILAVLIVGLLIFVVVRGTAPAAVSESEPELSVEQLLATTKENQSLDDIEFSDKSETRKMIEKFVDENPEAVAQLLRNWLNDDWG